jgi:ribosomal protein S27E
MKDQPKNRDNTYLEKYKYNDRIRLKSGTFLHCYCPKCSANLIVDNMVQILAVTESGEGLLELSPYLNVFKHHGTINVQPNTELKDVKCPHCLQSIVHPTEKCGDCNSHTAELSVAAVHIRVSFLICLKEGCHWHGITPEDEQLLIQDACDEW